MTEVLKTEGVLFHALRDPNHISDADFFGAWNEKEEKWDVLPILRYDKFGDLACVCNNVKSGNYEKAKEALLEYYSSNRACVPKYEPIVKPENFLAAELMKEKIFSFLQMDYCVGKAQLSTDFEYYEAELTTLSNSYFLFDADMNGSFAEIYSKENIENKPASLEVEADGKLFEFTAVSDTYISAGENKDKNYGDEPFLYVREAAGAPDMPMGNKTARTYLRFDIDDKIFNPTSIRLKFYGRSSAGNKKLFVFASVNEKYFDENKFTWSGHFPQAFNFKETGYIFKDGERLPTSHEKLWGVEYEWLNAATRLYPAGWCVSKYISSKEEVYAYRALEILIAIYTQRKSGIYPRILEGGWRTEYLCDILFGTIGSSCLTPEVLTAQLKYMYEHIVDLKDVEHAASNWESAIRVGFVRICAYVPEIVPKGFWEHGKTRLVDLFSKNTLTPSGAYLESCSGYIVGVVAEIKLCLKLIKMVDTESDEYYKKLLEQYIRLTRFYFNMTMNCGYTLPWGDGGRNNIKLFVQRENEFYKNPHFEYFASEGRSGTMPDYTSVLYPDKAIAFMRSDWEADGFSAMIHTDYGGNHAHYDDLSLDVCAYGSMLLVDVGIASYSPGSKLVDIAHSTISHNTIEIDYKNQKTKQGGRPGEPGIPQRLTLASNKLFDFAVAGSDMIYPGFDANRRVLFLHNSCFIVSDCVIPSDKEIHTYRQAWHPDAKNGLTIDSVTKTALTHYESGANIYIVPADPEKIEAEISETYMAHPVYREIKADYLSYNRGNVSGAQTFDTLLYPVKEGENAKLIVERINPEGIDTSTKTTLKITRNENICYYYCENEEAKGDGRFCEYTTDGSMGYVETNACGEVVLIALTKSEKLKKGELTLVESDNVINDLGLQWNRSELNIFSSDGNLSGIKIYSENPVTAVFLNGKGVDFTYKEAYIML